MNKLNRYTRSLRRNNQAFTIVELMVVIVVIGILTTIVVLSYQGVQRQTRDAQRETTVAIISSALEKYYEKNGEYPADDQFNTASEPDAITSLSGAATTLGLKESDLTTTSGSSLYAYCANGSTCNGTSSSWLTYRTKQFIYVSRKLGSGGGSYNRLQTPASYGSNTGWGCTLTAYYTDPGFAIAWYKESEKIWVFTRSNHGNVELTDYSGGPVAPQTCTFS